MYNCALLLVFTILQAQRDIAMEFFPKSNEMTGEEDGSTGASAGDDGFIPTEMVLEILKRLPSKFLYRLRCVSPEWLSLMTEPWFVLSHLAHSRSHPRILAVTLCRQLPDPSTRANRWFMYCVCSGDELGLWEDSSRVELPAPYLEPSVAAIEHVSERTYDIPRSVVGLICLKRRHRVDIYNPTTGELVCLPRKLGCDQYYHFNSSRWTSLCFDPVENQHKVLDSLEDPFEKRTHHHVFVPGGKTWRKIEDNIPFCVQRHKSGDEICVNGVLYYIAIPRYGLGTWQLMLVAFDVRDESFRQVQIKIPVEEDYDGPKLAEFFKGRVALVYWPVFKNKSYRNHVRPSKNVDSIHLMILEEGCLWSSKEVKLPPREVLPRYGVFKLAGCLRRGELLAFKWTPDGSHHFFLFYDAPGDMFWKLAEIHFLPAPKNLISCPVDGDVCISDHEENLLPLTGWADGDSTLVSSHSKENIPPSIVGKKNQGT